VTQTAQAIDLVTPAALAALDCIPIADPLTVGVRINASQVTLDGVAGTARFNGSRNGEVVVVVESEIAEALRNSPLGALDITAALAPALNAVASSLGTVVVGPGQALDTATALDALFSKGNAGLVPLTHQGAVRALIGLSITDEPEPQAPVASAPNYPTAAELRQQRAGATSAAPRARTGLELLRDVSMEVTAQIGTTRMTINELLTLCDGAVVELDRAAGAPADLLVNGHMIAKGEVVVIDENFALRITEIVADEYPLPGS
jgi:flagellar motor switch protein FliN/FliY